MQDKHPSTHYHSGRFALAVLTSLATLVLIFAGSVVTSKNVGLAVPDWPTSYGYHMWTMPFSLWKGGVLYEHLHRVIGSVIGCMVLVLTVWLIFAERRAWVRAVALATLGTVVLQGVLGGITVLMALPKAISVLHGILAQVCLALTVVLAYALSREGCQQTSPGTASGMGRLRMRRGCALLAMVILVQLALAAYMRHDMKHQGGVAIPDFPQVAGRWVPAFGDDAITWVNEWRADAVWSHGAKLELGVPVDGHQMMVHFMHRCLAAVILVALFWYAAAARGRRDIPPTAMRTLYAACGLVVVEAVLGMFTVWSNKGELITSLHVVTGAALLGAMVLAALRARPESESIPVSGGPAS